MFWNTTCSVHRLFFYPHPDLHNYGYTAQEILKKQYTVTCFTNIKGLQYKSSFISVMFQVVVIKVWMWKQMFGFRTLGLHFVDSSFM